MKKIPLTRGKFALVDNEDFERLKPFKWRYSTVGYATTVGSKRGDVIYMHRLILGTPMGMFTDHKNSDRLDNRKENLRICTKGENERNTPKRKNNTSGFKGIYWRKDTKKWTTHLMVNRKYIVGKCHEKIEDAIREYDEMARKYHGEFAYQNKI